MIGERFARRALTLEGLDGLCLSRRPLSRQFVLGCGCFQLFKLKLHLLQEPCLALRAAAVNLATQLLDLELEVTDQCLGRLRIGSFRFGARRDGFRLKARGALREDHCMRGGQVGGKRFRCGHDDDGITSITIREAQSLIRPMSAATSLVGASSQSRTRDNRAAPTRSSPHLQPGSAR